MNRRFLVMLAVFTMAAAVPAVAQTSSAGIAVSAANQGAFSLTIVTTDAVTSQYRFGEISSILSTNANGTEALTGVVGSGIVTFTSGAGAITWTVASAPARTVRIHNSSAAITSGWATGTNLKMFVSGAPVGSVTCPEITYATATDPAGSTCTGGALVHSIPGVGRNANAKSGSLQLKLTVSDTDATGTATWAVQLTAIGA